LTCNGAFHPRKARAGAETAAAAGADAGANTAAETTSGLSKTRKVILRKRNKRNIFLFNFR